VDGTLVTCGYVADLLFAFGGGDPLLSSAHPFKTTAMYFVKSPVAFPINLEIVWLFLTPTRIVIRA
jgi:hypothetical protein